MGAGRPGRQLHSVSGASGRALPSARALLHPSPPSGPNIPGKDVAFCRKTSLLAGICDLSLLVCCSFFAYISLVFLIPFIEETVFPPWYGFASFVINKGTCGLIWGP